MKVQALFLSTLAIFALPSLSQDFLSQFPQCALNCSTQVITAIPCSSTDKLCLCQDPQDLLAKLLDCATPYCKSVDIFASANSTSSFCDVPERNDSLVLEVTLGVFTGLAILIVSLRIVTRFHPFQVAFGWDDGLIISVLIASTTDTGLRYLSIANGFGRDVWTIPTKNITLLSQLFIVGACFYDYGIFVTKLSILAFYLRIFKSSSFRNATFILMGICTATLIATFFVKIFACTPVSFQWTAWSGETTGTCLNRSLFAWSYAAINIVLDIAVMVLPFPHILKLNLSRKKKVQIGVMFLLGLFVTITSIVRLRSLVKFRATSNFTFDYVGVVTFSLIEVNVGIICASLPALQLLLRRVAPRLFGSTIDATSYIHRQSAPGSRTLRNTGTRLAAHRTKITKTITTTVTTAHAQDGDSIIELVRTVQKDGEGTSFATTDTERGGVNQW